MKGATRKSAAKGTRRWRSRKQSSFAHLLVPVDFSECSQQALRYADQIAASFGSKVSVVNVIPLNEGLLRLGAEQLRVFDEEMRENQRCKLMGFVQTSI